MTGSAYRSRRAGRRFFLVVSVVLLVGVVFAGPALAAPGTIFVDGEDIGGGNVPHQGCNFEVEFVGFTESPGGTARVDIEAVAPTSGGIIGSGTTTLSDPEGDGVINITIDPTGIEQHPQQGLHVTIVAGVDGGDVPKTKTVWVEECAAPPPPTSPPPPTTPPVIVPTGGVETGSAAGPGPGLILPVVGLVLLVGSALWMRRRSIG